ncbi:MAG: hypothetical protein NXY57DRAFT_1033393 [Lentinula lateritia]|nr:MAG: hypothetical protein NXY57DRAFT_1033393 [Lentinula lateritia]
MLRLLLILISTLSFPYSLYHLLLCTPLLHLSTYLLSTHYLPYKTQTQLTPLQIIQPLLPLLRNPHGLPAVKTRVGLAFSDLQSMREVGTLRAAKVLRKEIR